MIKAFGDSITAGYGVNSNQNWVSLFSPTNNGLSGAQAAEIANSVMFTTPAPDVNSVYTIMVGSNDIYKYKNDSIKKEYYRKCLASAIGWLSLPYKISGQSMTKVGSWGNAWPTVNPLGIACSTNGNKASATISGDILYVSYTIQDYFETIGTANVKVDGSIVGQISCNGAGMTTHLGATYSSGLSAFSGLGGGSHNVEIEVTSPTGKYFFLNWIAGNYQTKPTILVGDILKWAEGGYYANGLSPTITEYYNQIIDDVLYYFDNTVLVENSLDIDPTIHISDGVHPNAAGHQIIFNNFRDALLSL